MVQRSWTGLHPTSCNTNQVYSSSVNSRTMLRALLQKESIVLKFMKDKYVYQIDHNMYFNHFVGHY